MRATRSDTFVVRLPRSDAITLFTPEGEREWVPGWQPSDPAGGASETVGTIFTTLNARD